MQQQLVSLNVLLSKKGLLITQKMQLEYFNPETVMRFVIGMLGGLSTVLSNIVLIFLTVTFILLEASDFPAKLRVILGDPKQSFPQYTKFVDDIKRYMIIKTLISMTAGFLIGIWLNILGVDFPVLWGFLAFLLHYVPNLGFIIAAIPAVLFALVQIGFGSAILSAAGYLIISFVLGNIVEPKLMGQRLGLSTLVVFLSLIFWGSLLGLVGVVMCIPLTMTLKFACENSKNMQWIAILLGRNSLLSGSKSSIELAPDEHPDVKPEK
jgi:predicted PurR-regulated permease PerM